MYNQFEKTLSNWAVDAGILNSLLAKSDNSGCFCLAKDQNEFAVKISLESNSSASLSSNSFSLTFLSSLLSNKVGFSLSKPISISIRCQTQYRPCRKTGPSQKGVEVCYNCYIYCKSIKNQKQFLRCPLKRQNLNQNIKINKFLKMKSCYMPGWLGDRNKYKLSRRSSSKLNEYLKVHKSQTDYSNKGELMWSSILLIWKSLYPNIFSRLDMRKRHYDSMKLNLTPF
ncbi:hypothetical protein AGLY_009863 [Aphis glycines]|uniref:Uncharacterized protein n=1 Tax=Aphis glycines TaxID=307491 RepID=A0A6G0TJ90_APHGL|nr:hypothetical protein AGLY_009863 [Aphis glycines]